MTEPIAGQLGDSEVTAYSVPEINPIPDAPYRGVEPFRFIDQQIFVGRENETWNLLSSIMIYRGVLLYGGSGSGKSSMINAGLIPQARKEHFIPNVLRVQPWAGREIKVERISIEHDGKPPYLPSSFISDDSQASFECSIEEIHSALKRMARSGPPEGLIDYTKPPEPRPMLIFDQFEEFITLFEEAASTNGNGLPNERTKAQRAILDAITDLIHDETLPIKILFVFREDYLGKLSILFENSPDLLDQYLRLLPPRVDRLQEIIRAPLKNQQLSAAFSKGQRAKAEELTKLADRIAVELRQHSGGSVNLSELQIVCRKLWDSDKPSALMKRDKCVQTLIEEYWADALKKFPDDLQAPAVALLGHMITSSNTRNIVSGDDMITDEKEHFEPELLKRALETLVGSKLVRREPRNNLYFYEIVSEYLVPWIQRLRDAQRAEFERIKTSENLERAEAQNRTLKRQGLVLVVLSLLILTTAAVLAYSFRAARKARDAEAVQRVNAENLKTEVERERDRNKEIIQLLQNLTSISPDNRLNAIAGIRNMAARENGKEGIPRELGLALLALAVTDKDPAVVKAANELVPEIVKSNPDLRQMRASIQIESQDNQDQKSRADRIKAALTTRGIVVDAYAFGGAMPSTNELRYCGSRGVAPEELLQDIKRIDENAWVTNVIRGCENSSADMPRYYEIWFASDRRAVVATLKLIENQWKRAKQTGNAAVLRQVFADEFTNTSEDGHTYNKREWVEYWRVRADPGYTWKISDVKLVSFGGNTATITFTNQTSYGLYRETDTFVKRNGRWQVLASQSTLISQ